MEARLQERGLLPPATGPSFSFLWFIAETERNVFLWRNGYSIAQADEFDFWVSVPDLIQKRLNQLELGSPDNPFINPLWGITNHSPVHAGREIEYLNALADVMSRIADQAFALSHVGSILRNEFSVERRARDSVVLPQKRPVAEKPGT